VKLSLRHVFTSTVISSKFLFLKVAKIFPKGCNHIIHDYYQENRHDYSIAINFYSI